MQQGQFGQNDKHTLTLIFMAFHESGSIQAASNRRAGVATYGCLRSCMSDVIGPPCELNVLPNNVQSPDGYS